MQRCERHGIAVSADTERSERPEGWARLPGFPLSISSVASLVIRIRRDLDILPLLLKMSNEKINYTTDD